MCIMWTYLIIIVKVKPFGKKKTQKNIQNLHTYKVNMTKSVAHPHSEGNKRLMSLL